MTKPTSATSNFGWALWHLEQAEAARVNDEAGAMYHAQAAQARATLALTAEHGAQRGVDPSGPSTWTIPDRPEETS